MVDSSIFRVFALQYIQQSYPTLSSKSFAAKYEYEFPVLMILLKLLLILLQPSKVLVLHYILKY